MSRTLPWRRSRRARLRLPLRRHRLLRGRPLRFREDQRARRPRRTVGHRQDVVRSSQGAVFSMPVAVCSSAEAVAWMQAKGIRSLATSPAATKTFWDVDCRGPSALLLGSEKDGLSDFMLGSAHEKISIPQAGLSDSLNVSMAAGIVLFEAVRQRRK
ncbi:MAG: RNA methyltransferase [Verrucomicrobia bacterium]|nr:RNA methyltransferase [Verrucomicrobiota bacterium]